MDSALGSLKLSCLAAIVIGAVVIICWRNLRDDISDIILDVKNALGSKENKFITEVVFYSTSRTNIFLIRHR